MKTPKMKYRIAALTLVLMLLVLVWERQPYRFLVRGQLFCELCAGEYRQRAGGRRGGPYYTGEPGDVIAMGNDHFRHIVMISEVLTDESGNTADYLICSNTGDLCDFPAGAYFYTYQQLIKIHGWN